MDKGNTVKKRLDGKSNACYVVTPQKNSLKGRNISGPF